MSHPSGRAGKSHLEEHEQLNPVLLQGLVYFNAEDRRASMMRRFDASFESTIELPTQDIVLVSQWPSWEYRRSGNTRSIAHLFVLTGLCASFRVSGNMPTAVAR